MTLSILRQANKSDLRKNNILISPGCGTKVKLLRKMPRVKVWEIENIEDSKTLFMPSDMVEDFQIEGKLRKPRKPRKSAFCIWLDRLIDEKGIDVEIQLEIKGKEWGMNIMPLSIIIDGIKNASKEEQKAIKNNLVIIDFNNGSVLDYFKHLGQAIAI